MFLYTLRVEHVECGVVSRQVFWGFLGIVCLAFLPPSSLQFFPFVSWDRCDRCLVPLGWGHVLVSRVCYPWWWFSIWGVSANGGCSSIFQPPLKGCSFSLWLAILSNFRRALGQEYLKSTLGELVNEVVDQKNLVLEINPLKVLISTLNW